MEDNKLITYFFLFIFVGLFVLSPILTLIIRDFSLMLIVVLSLFTILCVFALSTLINAAFFAPILPVLARISAWIDKRVKKSL